jgi:hypothetical protein
MDNGYMKDASRGWMDGADIMDNGVYVQAGTSGKIKLNGGVGGNVTLVSADEIDLSGSTSTLRPYYAGLLVFSDGGNDACNPPLVKFSGSNINWAGIMFAPHTEINMSFSANATFFGSIIANTVNLSGAQTTITYDPDYIPPQPDTIELGE